MKKVSILLIFCTIAANIIAGNLNAYMSYAAFNTPNNNPYLETYLTIKGSSVTHVFGVDSLYHGSVDVQIIFRQNDSIVNFAKYRLTGPGISDILNGFPNFLDVQRYELGDGTFDIELKMDDPNSNDEPIVSYDSYTMNFNNSPNQFSDIELLNDFAKSNGDSNFERNGYQLVPYVFSHFPENANEIKFYTEIYNNKIDDNNDQFLLTYYLRPFELNKKLENYTFIKRMKANNVNPVLGKIDISNLPSGNYYLIVEARDKNNNLLASKESFFSRFKPQTEFKLEDIYQLDPSGTFVSDFESIDTLRKYIAWLKPISTDVEKAYAQSFMQDGANLDEMKKYFLNFWVTRDELFPVEAWKKYRFQVIKANHHYSTQNTPGYDTDRGRVFLQYGEPNAIAESHNEPNAYPYEIWHYYSLADNQKDIKFVFYTQEIATNDFQLIHSNAIGELNNYKWRIWINNRDTRYTNLMNVDDSHYREIWGSNQDDYYSNPR